MEEPIVADWNHQDKGPYETSFIPICGFLKPCDRPLFLCKLGFSGDECLIPFLIKNKVGRKQQMSWLCQKASGRTCMISWCILKLRPSLFHFFGCFFCFFVCFLLWFVTLLFHPPSHELQIFHFIVESLDRPRSCPFSGASTSSHSVRLCHLIICFLHLMLDFRPLKWGLSSGLINSACRNTRKNSFFSKFLCKKENTPVYRQARIKRIFLSSRFSHILPMTAVTWISGTDFPLSDTLWHLGFNLGSGRFGSGTFRNAICDNTIWFSLQFRGIVWERELELGISFLSSRSWWKNHKNKHL